jgi:hypothetical protein
MLGACREWDDTEHESRIEGAAVTVPSITVTPTDGGATPRRVLGACRDWDDTVALGVQ